MGGADDAAGRVRAAPMEAAAFAKYEFRWSERPAFCKECAAGMKSVDERWCRTCKTWATKAEGDGPARHDGDGSIAEFGEAGETRKSKTLCCAYRNDVTGTQKSRADNADWKKMLPKLRCSSAACLSLFDDKVDMSEEQTRLSAAGGRLRRSCAEAKEKATRRTNAEVANRERKV